MIRLIFNLSGGFDATIQKLFSNRLNLNSHLTRSCRVYYDAFRISRGFSFIVELITMPRMGKNSHWGSRNHK
ncbi:MULTISPECIES: hypothetical protein [unclassified Coleofasciculus]|uniref:hypothetical protein n=1 Tax=unclassified Coleofasciculus TaxID=2692782 RepID=UPI00187E3E98|nr:MULTISPECIES: hypothetical protein [unclassified Coleofasciculus]MBE9129278.1 hypothetical protein [Coleofasciculus sp. LEGE 07081]MBE9151914.1 hypothetical protein [Coleofasciculus sp. LEGE 07092]